jgi:hypothetical protein
VNCKRGFLVLLFGLGLEILAATLGYAQQPLLQITAPASNSLATEGRTLTLRSLPIRLFRTSTLLHRVRFQMFKRRHRLTNSR